MALDTKVVTFGRNTVFFFDKRITNDGFKLRFLSMKKPMVNFCSAWASEQFILIHYYPRVKLDITDLPHFFTKSTKFNLGPHKIKFSRYLYL